MFAAAMDVDQPAAAERTIAVHPLSIVSMADQYTRIITGGSPLDVNEPAVGLLFGVMSDAKRNSLRVTDAEDIPVNRSTAAETQISLHQAVFPQHAVVGWYRVSATENSPTPEDLLLSQQLAQHYQRTDADSGTGTGTTPTAANTPFQFLFALLQVNQAEQPESKGNEEELPFSLFAVDLQQQVLVGLDDQWSLETAVSERIAVERVLREQPPQKDTDVTSPFVVHTGNLQQSVAAIQDRITVLEQFLELTASGAIPYDHALIRQVQGLLLHASFHSASNITITPDVSPDALLQQLAVLAKCVSAVQQYTDKARAVHESNTTVRSGRGLFSSFKK